MRRITLTAILAMAAMIGATNAQASEDFNGPSGMIIAAGDFNHDGSDDLLVAEPLGLVVWLGDKQGHFRKTAGRTESLSVSDRECRCEGSCQNCCTFNFFFCYQDCPGRCAGDEACLDQCADCFLIYDGCTGYCVAVCGESIP